MADETGRFGLGVIGAGMGAKPHALALEALSDQVNVLGVYRRDATKRAEFCRTYGFAEAEDYDALLADPRLDAVLVVTPPNAREAIVAKAAAAGKHVLMEKPVERTLAAAQRIVDLCDGAGVKLGIVFQHRFRRASRLLAAIVAENRFGPLEAVHLAVPWWRPQQGYYDQPGRGTLAQDGGGVLITQAIHSLDLMLSLCGDVSAVTSMARTTRLHQMETEDFVAGGLEFANGAVGALMATTASFPGGPEVLTLNFARASARLTAGNLTVETMDGTVLTEGEANEGGGGADPMAFPFDWHQAQMEDFIAAVREDRPPLSTGHTALKVHGLIEALMQSSHDGKRVVL